MKTFSGFPSGMTFTPVPNVFLARLMPEISDINELKVVLYAMSLLYTKKGQPRFVTAAELLANPAVSASLKSEVPAETALQNALDSAEKGGIFIKLATGEDKHREDLYFLNTDKDRQAVAKIRSGELKLPGIKAPAAAAAVPAEPPNIFSLYEDNIGMLTPMVSEELKDAQKQYPPGWIADAIKESACNNKRNIRYIIAILERWSAEGKDDGTHRRDTEKDESDKYFRGKYGHLVQH